MLEMLGRFRGVSLRSLLTYVVFSGLLFVYLTITNQFYPPLSLRVAGAAAGATTLQVRYDFGDGFKAFQQENVDIHPDEVTGAFSVSFDLPQVTVSRIRLTVLNARQSQGGAAETISRVMAGTSQHALLIQKEEIGDSVEYELSLHDVVKAVFSRRQLSFHLCIAAFVAALLQPLLLGLVGTPRGSWRQTLMRFLIAEGRAYFWLMFLVACAVQGCWVLAYWPASMTNDSWIALLEAQSLKITDWHPYPYTYWLTAMMHLFHSVAAIAVFQLLATAALVSYILWYSGRLGAPKLVVVFFYVLFLGSIPIGLFNTLVWKDIPFSVGILALSFLVFRAHVSTAAGARLLLFSTYQYFLLAALFTVVCQFRHNGLIFYAIIPFLFLGALAKREYLRVQGVLALVFVALNLVFPKILGIERTTASPQQEYRTALAIMTHFNFYSKDRKQDQRIIEEATKMSWAEISKLYPRNWFEAWDRSEIQRRQFLPGNGHTKRYNKSFIARLSLTNLPILISSRTFEFFHSLGLDQSTSDYTTDFFQNPLQLHGTNLEPPGSMRFKVAIESKPPSDFLRTWLRRLAKWSMIYDGLMSRQVVIWNLLGFLTLQLAIIFVEGGLSAISLFVLPGLACAAAVFASGAGESWRYFYYLYLTGIVTIPLYLGFIRSNSRRRLRESAGIREH